MRTFTLVAAVFGSGFLVTSAHAQGGACMMRGSGSVGPMMSPMTGSMRMGNFQSPYAQQTQLAYQYQMQLAQMRQQAQMEQAYLREQSELATKKAEKREQRIAERRERLESDKARRAAAKAEKLAHSASEEKLAAVK